MVYPKAWHPTAHPVRAAMASAGAGGLLLLAVLLSSPLSGPYGGEGLDLAPPGVPWPDRPERLSAQPPASAGLLVVREQGAPARGSAESSLPRLTGGTPRGFREDAPREAPESVSPAASREKTRPRPSPSAAGRPAPRRHPAVVRALQVFGRLKGSPRYKRSPVLAAWTREFLSYPDLKAIDDRFNRDRDPVRYLADAVRSPNFHRLAARYLTSPDVAAFLGDLAADRRVALAGREHLKDPVAKAMLESLRLPALARRSPSLAAAPR